MTNNAEIAAQADALRKELEHLYACALDARAAGFESKAEALFAKADDLKLRSAEAGVGQKVETHIYNTLDKTVVIKRTDLFMISRKEIKH